jgi:hypothetical protein
VIFVDDLRNQSIFRLMDTLSGVNQDRVRQKRRQIEAHFKDPKQIAGAALTIASEEIRETSIGGYFLRVNATPPLKAMPMVSEGYCVDSAHAHILSPVFLALSSIYCLNLAQVPVTFHFVSLPAMERLSDLLSGKSQPKDLIEEGVVFLCKLLPKVELLSCLKGPFFEKMQSKMYQVKRHNVSEVVSLDFEVIARALLDPAS